MKLALKIAEVLSLVAAFWWLRAIAMAPEPSQSSQPTPSVDNAVANPVARTAAAKQSGQSGQSDQLVGQVIADFDGMAEAEQWWPVNDNVMGGLSQGSFSITLAGTGVFSGTISLENNGGFSSVRRDSQNNEFADVENITLRVKGDGRRYQLRLRTDDSSRAIAYRAEFNTTENEWATVQLSLNDFEPVFRGRIVENAPDLVARDIQQIGLLLADKQSGEFRLEIDWIRSEP